MVASWFRIARSGALLAIAVSVAQSADARGFGGGGFRGGGSMSMSRGGGFGSGGYGSRGSYSRGDSYGSGSRGTFSRGGEYSKPSALEGGGSGRHVDGSGSRATHFGVRSNPSTRPGAGGSGTQVGGGDLKPAQLPSGGGAATRPGGGGSATQLPARPGQGGSGVEWRPIDNRPGGGGSGTQWRPDCPKCSDGNEGWFDHPVAAGVVIGAVATAAAIGSMWYALPPGCPPYYWDTTLYYTCDGAYYLPQYEGDTIVYVTVPDPKGGEQPAKE